MGKKNISKQNHEGFRSGYTFDEISVTSSIALQSYEKRRMNQLLDDILQSRSSRQYLKMLSYQLIPLIALVVMCSILLTQSAMVHSGARQLQMTVQNNDNVGRLISSLQVERGLSTAYLSSNRSQSTVYDELIEARRNTYEAYVLIQNWPEMLYIKELKQPNDKATVQHELLQHRQHVDDELFVWKNSMDNIIFYTNINEGLIESKIIETSQIEASIWYQLIAKQSLFRAADFYGIERALGSAFYVQCALSDDDLSWIRTVRTQGDMMLDQAINYYSRVQIAYDEYLNRSKVYNAHLHMQKMREEISNNSNICKRNNPETTATKSLGWFNNSTRLINILTDVSSEISSDILNYVERTKQDTFHKITLYSLTGTLTILACVILSIFHARKSHSLLSSISHYAKDLSEKKTELASEKKLTLKLVYQLIPKGVAKQLQAGKSVEAMVFEEVTIYFSNIEGFANFASRSTPMQVINLLNELHR